MGSLSLTPSPNAAGSEPLTNPPRMGARRDIRALLSSQRTPDASGGAPQLTRPSSAVVECVFARTPRSYPPTALLRGTWSRRIRPMLRFVWDPAAETPTAAALGGRAHQSE